MSIRQLRTRLVRDDAGMSIVEVLTAFVVFSIIAIGMVASMASMTKLTADSDNREAATNLAAAEIDRVQAISDAFAVTNQPAQTITVDGVPFSIDTKLTWVGADGSANGSCGTAGSNSNLLYKSVNVQVSWPGMVANNPVRADSALAPASRVNDPSFGTILINVKGAGGNPRPGVTVTVVNKATGAALADPIDLTDADGCTYVLKVNPATYTVKVSRTGYMNPLQQTFTVVDKTVTAGNTTSVGVDYEQAASFALKYGANAAAAPAQQPIIPTGLTTTFVYGPSTYQVAGTASPLPLYADASYTAIAGNTLTCAANDPVNWQANATQVAGMRVPPVGAAPGGSAVLPIAMGIATAKATADGTLTAVQQSSGPAGTPACATPTTLTFGAVTNNSTYTVALPYGSWKLSVKKSDGSFSAINSNITVLGGVVAVNPAPIGGLLSGLPGASAVTGGVLTLDPRAAVS